MQRVRKQTEAVGRSQFCDETETESAPYMGEPQRNKEKHSTH